MVWVNIESYLRGKIKAKISNYSFSKITSSLQNIKITTESHILFGTIYAHGYEHVIFCQMEDSVIYLRLVKDKASQKIWYKRKKKNHRFLKSPIKNYISGILAVLHF